VRSIARRFAGLIDAGTYISASIPARAAYVATAVPAFPDESSTTRLASSLVAVEIITVAPRSLNDPVGRTYSSLNSASQWLDCTGGQGDCLGALILM